MRAPLKLLPRNTLSLAGVSLAVTGGLLFIIMFIADLLGLQTNPYMGIVFFLLLPAVFVLGLLLIPIGVWRERARRRAGKTAESHWPQLDLNDPHQRKMTLAIAVLTLVNVVIVSLGVPAKRCALTNTEGMATRRRSCRPTPHACHRQ